MLQPFLENVVEHGMAGDDCLITVNIEVSRRGDDLLVGITDTGAGFEVGVRREGIGLANTRARLLELYGNRCRFEYGNLPAGGASVRISIPFHVTPAAAVGQAAGTDHELDARNAVASQL
jgi:two-component system LytT family sensor kinase